MKKKLLTAALTMTAIMSCSMNVLAFDPATDAEKCTSISGTNLYVEKGVSEQETNDVHAYWNMIPASVKKLMKDYGIKMYLTIADDPGTVIGSNEAINLEDVVITPDSPDLIPIKTNIDWAPRFIEKDPYNIENMKITTLDGKKVFIYHGYVSEYHDGVEKNWEQLKANYMEDAPFFATILDQLRAEVANPPKDTVMVSATSWGCDVVYDADNDYRFVSVHKPGYTVYYANNDAYIPETIIHEAGHHLDWLSPILDGKYSGTLFGISDSQEWTNLYNANVGKLSGIDAAAASNMTLNKSEGFADSFRLAYQKPDALKAACPDVYNFVLKMVAKYNTVEQTRENFDATAYADTYPDLKEAFGYDENKLWEHWINFGKNEGRVACFK